MLGVIFWQEVACRGLAILQLRWLGSVLPRIQARLEDVVQGRLFSEPRQNGPGEAEHTAPKILKTVPGEQRQGGKHQTWPGAAESLSSSFPGSHLDLQGF